MVLKKKKIKIQNNIINITMKLECDCQNGA